METTLLNKELSITKTDKSISDDLIGSLYKSFILPLDTYSDIKNTNKLDLFYNVSQTFYNIQLKEYISDPQQQNLKPLIEESSDQIDENIVKSRDVILNEKWSNIINLQALIISTNKDLIQCECLVDKENKLFETRTFPSIIFHNLNNLHVGQPILISIKSKPGSIRIDINDGKGFVEKELFNANADFEKLEAKFKNAGIKTFDPNNA